MNGKKLRPETAEELKQSCDPRGIRRRLAEYSYDNPLVHAVFSGARAQGYSGEDTMTVLAYEALLRLEQYEEAALHDVMTNIKPHIVTPS